MGWGRGRRAGLAVLGAGTLVISACAGGPTATARLATEAPSPSATLSARPPAQPPPSLSQARIDGAVARLDGVVGDTMARTGVPGLAVAVVHRDRTLYLKGFGVRRVGSPGKVGPDTVFQLASLSKPLAATVVAGAVGRGTVAWDDPVVEHDEGFALKDPWVTRHVTLADLFSHRSGLPDHAGDLLEDLGYDRAYILRHLRDEPLAPFRASYAYTNFGLTEAALAVAKASGTSWEELSAKTLYEPLGMRSTSSRFTDYAKAPDRAADHVKVDGHWAARFTRDPQAQSPAGGASSTARDMIAWLRLQLGDGLFAGRRVIGAEPLGQTYLPHIVSNPPSAPFGGTGFYGLGWNVNYDDAGRLRLNHSGAFSLGAATTATLLPSEGLGIVVLTNGEPMGAPEAVASAFFDIAQHGRQTVDWLGLVGEIFAQTERSERSKLDYSRPPAGAAPAKAPASYTGTYANGYYGPLTVIENGGKLVMLLGPQDRRFPLTHYAGDVFSYPTQGENAVGLSGARFTFGAGGEAARVTLESLDHTGLGTFTRRP
ncbi:MAG TPA: serine hydrolase [Nonomuraea sp.]|nr:serine hydrolase [Nonomuraea sp.]